MAKYIGTYATSGDVQTALDNLELSRPFVAYTTDNDEVIYGPAADRAEVGDIVVYSTADDLLHYIKQADYSASTYPTAAYVPVGVVAMTQADDAILGPTGEITFLGLNWLDKNKPDTGNTSKQNIEWGNRNFDIPELTNYVNSGTAITDMNGKANTEAVLQYATAQTNWKTDSAITWANAAGYYPLFECAWRYHTSGTVQGDWYVPAAGQIAILVNNSGNNVSIEAGLKLIDNRLSNDTTGQKGTSTEASASDAYHYSNSGLGAGGTGKSSPYDWATHPYCSKLMTRI